MLQPGQIWRKGQSIHITNNSINNAGRIIIVKNFNDHFFLFDDPDGNLIEITWQFRSSSVR